MGGARKETHQRKGKSRTKKSQGTASPSDKPGIDSDDAKQLAAKEAETSVAKADLVRPVKGDEADQDDDDELMAAAAEWADNQETEGGEGDEKMAEPNTPITEESPTQEPLSLHMTQLPFDANELEIRRLLAEKGCSVTAIRLVYDRDEMGRKTVFRGVAFVDMLDSESYDKAMKLNRKCTIRGRKLNIRPTRSKQELASIVSRTKEMVQEKIRKQRESDNTEGGKQPVASVRQKKREKQRDKKAKAKAKVKRVKHSQDGEKSKSKDGAHKVTKKERNRRAAIIKSLKNKGK